MFSKAFVHFVSKIPTKTKNHQLWNRAPNKLWASWLLEKHCEMLKVTLRSFKQTLDKSLKKMYAASWQTFE